MFPIIFISRFLFFLPSAQWFCISLRLFEAEAGPIILPTHILSIFSNNNSLATGPFLPLETMATFQVNNSWTWIYFSLPCSSLIRAGCRYCSSFPRFHGFMILYAFHSDFFHIDFFPSFFRQIHAIVGSSTLTPPCLSMQSERKWEKLNFLSVIIRYNQITSDTEWEKVYSQRKIWWNDDDSTKTKNNKTVNKQRKRWQKDTDELSSTTTKTIFVALLLVFV